MKIILFFSLVQLSYGRYGFKRLNLSAHSSSEPRIVGGELTTIDKLPYLISLYGNGQFSCGGSLITPQCVLTAAHCVHGTILPSSLTVKAGVSKLSDLSTPIQVQKSFVSGLYSPKTLDMDVAILKLQQPLYGRNIDTIRLCNTPPNANDYVRISGWGLTMENNREPSNQVRTTMVKVLGPMECMKSYIGQALITDTMFCASVPGERDSCSGDSGGPVVYHGQVCGIVSWGFGCAQMEYPGVYTNVASLRIKKFINSVVRENCV